MHARLCNGAEASLPWKLLQTYVESCASIVQAVVCRPLLPCVLLSRPNPSHDAVWSRNPSKSTLAQTRSPLWCRISIRRASVLVHASSNLSMGRTRTWSQTSRFYFRRGFRGLFLSFERYCVKLLILFMIFVKFVQLMSYSVTTLIWNFVTKSFIFHGESWFWLCIEIRPIVLGPMTTVKTHAFLETVVWTVNWPNGHSSRPSMRGCQ